MKHVSFCGLRLRALVVITSCAAAALAFASPALAARSGSLPQAGTITKQTNPPTEDHWTDLDTVFGMMAEADCAPDGDPFAPGQCSVHELDPLDAGRVEVVVDLTQFGPTNANPQVAVAAYECRDPVDLDPLGQPLPVQTRLDAICDPNALDFRSTQIPPAGTAFLPQTRITFNVRNNDPITGEPVFYEIRVIPLQTGLDVVKYAACAGYIDNGADPCPNDARLNTLPPLPDEPVPADEFLTCNTNGAATGNRRMTGSGQINDPSGAKREQVSVSVRQRAEKRDRPQGQINHRFFPTKRQFHSKRLVCAAFVDPPARTLEVAGIGWVKFDGKNKPQKVCFRARFHDADGAKNQGTGDNFELQTLPFFRNNTSTTSDDTCGASGVAGESHGGVLTKGNFRYRTDRGADCEYDDYDRDRSYSRDDEYDWSHENR
jgi:hypothetical protein